MDSSLFPTKGNLILAKNRLALSKQGYDLMDQKRNILIQEMMMLLDSAKEIQSEIDSTFTTAYASLQNTNIALGISTVRQIAKAIELEDQIDIKYRSIMGVEIPMIGKLEESNELQYGFSRTTVSLDETYLAFLKVKRLSLMLAEVENAIYRLAINIRQTQKRANALKNIVIPNYEVLTKSMTNALEEKEREEFTRLSMIKNLKM